MKEKQATIKTIADHVGVHYSTVSRVLNRDKSKKISDETKEKIFTAAQELGYRKNKIAERLKRGTGDLCVLICSDRNISMYNTLYLEIIASLQVELGKKGKYIVFHQYTRDSERFIYENIDNNLYSGLILLGPQYYPVFDSIAQTMPVLQVTYEKPSENIHFLFQDYDYKSKLLYDFLAQKGKRNINVLAIDEIHPYIEQFEHLKRSLAQYPNLSVSFNYLDAYHERQKTLEKQEITRYIDGYDTIVFHTSWGLTFYNEMLMHGVRVPDDISYIISDLLPSNKGIFPYISNIGISPAGIARHIIDFFDSPKKEKQFYYKPVLFEGATVSDS